MNKVEFLIMQITVIELWNILMLGCKRKQNI